jgi:hypothetical protein
MQEGFWEHAVMQLEIEDIYQCQCVVRYFVIFRSDVLFLSQIR